MHRLIRLFVLALTPPLFAAPLPTTTTGRLATLSDTYVTESGPTIELVAVAHTPTGRIVTARATLPPTIRRERDPHRLTFIPGTSTWEACWRILDHARPGGAVGCIRRRVRGNNHPDLRHPPEALLTAAWSFDLPAQRFTYDPAPPLPTPRPLKSPWRHQAFHVPLPLQSMTPAVLKRALRAQGADISDTPESATALILPDRADICAFDRASRPAAILPALRRGVPVIHERALESMFQPPL